jgi:UV DNA damage endonuclease
MRIGYPCINRALDCRVNRTFRLRSYSRKRLLETVENNLQALGEILAYNVRHGILFFRITSDLVPFASHPVMRVDWRAHFQNVFHTLGRFIRKNGMRISMHPDQFVLINSPRRDVHRRSVRELAYHADLLDAMELDTTAKIQLHVGGVYGDRDRSLARFERRYAKLSRAIRRRLVIENDDRCYPAADCLALHRATGVPVLLDVFHHALLNGGEPMADVLRACAGTWATKQDGLPIVHYSSQKRGGSRGRHAETLDRRDFVRFLASSRGTDADVMLEIKDKEKSALRALKAAARDKRLVTAAE